MDKIEKLVLKLHNQECSVKEISRRCAISEYKVVKILCSFGAYHSPKAIEIMRLWKNGKLQDEIAKSLHISYHAVHRYIPYVRGVYLSEDPTENALRIRRCRENKKQIK